MATNNQNPINPKDLLSNSKEQIELQRYFYEIYGVYYQRKRNDLSDINGNMIDKRMIVSNDKVGQAALSCLKSLPYVALASKGKVFTTHSNVFNEDKEKIALSYFIYEKVLLNSKEEVLKGNKKFTSILKYGRFHITYLIYIKYVSSVNIELNKKIKNNDLNFINEMYLVAYIFAESIPEDKKTNCLAYFKTKKVFDVILKILNYFKEEHDKNIDIIELCSNCMVIKINDIEMKVNIKNGTVDIYKKFIYDEFEQDGNVANNITHERQGNLVKLLGEHIKSVPVGEKDSESDVGTYTKLVGYFDMEFEADFISDFINVIKNNSSDDSVCQLINV